MTDSGGQGGDRPRMPRTPSQSDTGPARRILAVPVTEDGQIAPGWGRARRVAVAITTDGVLTKWSLHEVGWDASHDEGGEGAHHARIAQFLIDNHVDAVVVDHVGSGMVRMLTTMGIGMLTGATGNARAAVETAGQHRPDRTSPPASPGLS